MAMNFTSCKTVEKKQDITETETVISGEQQDFLGIEKRRWVLANNEDIPIQKSNQGSLGFVFTKNNLYFATKGHKFSCLELF